MDDLQRFFRDALDGQIKTIEAALTRYEAGDADAEDALRRLAHSVRGSAASFGHPAVGHLATAAEQDEGDAFALAIRALLDGLHHIAESTQPRTVLVVDDDPLISRLLQMRLSAPDRRVLVAESIDDALARLESAPPDLLILDLVLPDGDGRSLLTELRHDDATAGLPIVVVSGSASPRAECEELGADAFVTKPFDPDALAALVGSILRADPAESHPRGAMLAAYRSAMVNQSAATLASVIPETHGPGGRHNDGPDPTVLDAVAEALTGSIGTDATIAKWADDELAVVVAGAVHEQLANALDQGRLRLRNTPHPAIEGAIVSFSAGIITDEGARGLGDGYGRARRLALAANQAGGDRVQRNARPRQGGMVLLAEDDALTAALIIHRLESEGFTVEHHGDGISAVEAVEARPFDLVVLDIQMPGLDGFGVLSRIREIEPMNQVPVVMLTAAGNERDVVRGFDLGADDYILKPFSPAELTARLKRFTRG